MVEVWAEVLNNKEGNEGVLLLGEGGRVGIGVSLWCSIVFGTANDVGGTGRCVQVWYTQVR